MTILKDFKPQFLKDKTIVLKYLLFCSIVTLVIGFLSMHIFNESGFWESAKFYDRGTRWVGYAPSFDFLYLLPFGIMNTLILVYYIRDRFQNKKLEVKLFDLAAAVFAGIFLAYFSAFLWSFIGKTLTWVHYFIAPPNFQMCLPVGSTCFIEKFADFLFALQNLLAFLVLLVPMGNAVNSN